MSRGAVTPIAVALLALLSLWALPPIALIPLFLASPAVAGRIATGGGPSREQYGWAGLASALALGAASALWVALNPQDGIHPVARILSPLATFFFVTIVTAGVVILASNRYPKASQQK